MIRSLLLAAGVALAAIPAAFADTYPSKPVTYIVPYPPGATNDNSARVIARKLQERLGQPVVIENKAGGGGTLGSDIVAKSKPDGYTLLNFSSGNLSTAPLLTKVGYDPFKDFVILGLTGISRSVIAVHPSVPAKTLKEFIDYAKANPGKLNFSSAGNGTGGHLAGEYLKLRTGIDMVHVPYRGSAAAVNDVVGGLIQAILDPIAATYVRSGKIRGLAVTGNRPAEDLPGVPSIAEAGISDWELTSFFGVAAPAATAPDIVTLLNRTLNEIAVDPEAVTALKGIGLDPKPQTVAEVTELLRRERDVNKRIIDAAHIKAD